MERKEIFNILDNFNLPKNKKEIVASLIEKYGNNNDNNDNSNNDNNVIQLDDIGSIMFNQRTNENGTITLGGLNDEPKIYHTHFDKSNTRNFIAYIGISIPNEDTMSLKEYISIINTGEPIKYYNENDINYFIDYINKKKIFIIADGSSNGTYNYFVGDIKILNILSIYGNICNNVQFNNCIKLTDSPTDIIPIKYEPTFNAIFIEQYGYKLLNFQGMITNNNIFRNITEIPMISLDNIASETNNYFTNGKVYYTNINKLPILTIGDRFICLFGNNNTVEFTLINEYSSNVNTNIMTYIDNYVNIRHCVARVKSDGLYIYTDEI